MPPRTNSRGSTPGRATPVRTGLRSQTPRTQASQEASAIPQESNATAADEHSELPDLTPRTSQAYGGPSRSAIASETVASTGNDSVANVFGSALTNAMGRTTADDDNTAEEVEQESPTLTSRATRRSNRIRSESSELSEAATVSSSTNARATRRSTRASQHAQATTAMPSIPENSNSPGNTTVQTTDYDTTRLDHSRAAGFATPSRPSSSSGYRQTADDITTASTSPLSHHLVGSSSVVQNHSSVEKSGPAINKPDVAPHGLAKNRVSPPKAQTGSARPQSQPVAPQPQQAQPEPRQVANEAAQAAAPRAGNKIINWHIVFLIFVFIISFNFGKFVPPRMVSYSDVGQALSTRVNTAKAAVYSHVASYAPRDKDGNLRDPRLEGRVGALETYVGNLAGHVSNLKVQMDMVIKNLNLHEITLKSLEDALPAKVFVHKTKDGEYQIPDEFWKAIQARFERDEDGVWRKFLEKNFKKVSEWDDRRTATQADPNFQAWKSEHEALDLKQFLNLLNNNYADLKSHLETQTSNYDRKFRELQERINTVSISAQEDRQLSDPNDPFSMDFPENERMQGVPQHQLTALARINLVKNAATHLQKINLFAPSLGAQINPFRSSPTADKLSLSLPHRSFFQVFKGYAPNPHIMALEPWSEPKDCWCAAPISATRHRDVAPKTADPYGSDVGAESAQLQLGIKLAQPVYPKEITIEHFPERGNVDSSSMPKDMELWIRVEDDAKREKLLFDSQVVLHETEMDQRRGKDNGVELGGQWVKVAKFTYERAHPNHVQTFPVDVSTLKHGVGTDDVVLRATSNYGGDATCLYRVRLHGDLVPRR